MVGWLGPSTPYDLKRAVSTTIGNFWRFPHAQLYSEPPRLAGAGLLEEEREHQGRRRRRFRLTGAGRAALRAWLAEPGASTTEIRDLGLLRLFFGSAAASPDDVARGARAQARAHREKLAAYEALRGGGPDPHVAATLRLGMAYERAAVAFWDEVAEGG